MFVEKSNLFTIIFQSAATGYFTYFLLKSNDVLILSNAQKEEKTALVLLLSAFNLSIYWLIQKVVEVVFSNINEGLNVIVTTIFSFFAVLVIGLFILPKIITYFFHWINKQRVKQGKLEFTRQAIRDSALDHPYSQYIYIFDFENKYIASGYLHTYQYNTDVYNELLLYAPREPEKRRTVESVEILFSKYDINILIDYEKKFKLYIIPMDEVEDE
ncbi:hypothetical protein AB3H85_00900 [Enterococcus sp. C78]|jgi:magnesium-transporting ATPase (P-type)|uniref:hypothetical protein n=1 Tax=Enterococcus sp. C78 TaxID=3231336 RepID=UPI0034A0841C